MFASKTPRDLNHDPLPYLYASTDYTARFSHNNLGYPYASSAIYDPRPEFDHVQHNEPNPILVEFREESEALGRMHPADWARTCSREFWGKEVSRDMLHHARRVLTRLANLAQIGENA